MQDFDSGMTITVRVAFEVHIIAETKTDENLNLIGEVCFQGVSNLHCFCIAE